MSRNSIADLASQMLQNEFHLIFPNVDIPDGVEYDTERARYLSIRTEIEGFVEFYVHHIRIVTRTYLSSMSTTSDTAKEAIDKILSDPVVAERCREYRQELERIDDNVKYRTRINNFFNQVVAASSCS